MAKRDGVDQSNDLIQTWRPQWHGPFEAWAKAYIGQNLWRVERLFEYEDAVQECIVVFLRCCRQYEGTVTNGAHFMSLFQRAVINDFTTLQRRNQRLEQAEAAYAATAYQRDAFELPVGPLLVTLNRASRELQDVLRVLVSGPNELVRLMLDWSNNGLREGLKISDNEAAFSRSLCRLARTKVREDLLSELRSLMIT